MSYINTEEMTRAAQRMEQAAKEATQAADRMEQAVFQLRQLLEPGYGNNASALVELLQKLPEPSEAEGAQQDPDALRDLVGLLDDEDFRDNYPWRKLIPYISERFRVIKVR